MVLEFWKLLADQSSSDKPDPDMITFNVAYIQPNTEFLFVPPLITTTANLRDENIAEFNLAN